LTPLAAATASSTNAWSAPWRKLADDETCEKILLFRRGARHQRLQALRSFGIGPAAGDRRELGECAIDVRDGEFRRRRMNGGARRAQCGIAHAQLALHRLTAQERARERHLRRFERAQAFRDFAHFGEPARRLRHAAGNGGYRRE
jgi:hypothetical protein